MKTELFPHDKQQQDDLLSGWKAIWKKRFSHELKDTGQNESQLCHMTLRLHSNWRSFCLIQIFYANIRFSLSGYSVRTDHSGVPDHWPETSTGSVGTGMELKFYFILLLLSSYLKFLIFLIWIKNCFWNFFYKKNYISLHWTLFWKTISSVDCFSGLKSSASKSLN